MQELFTRFARTLSLKALNLKIKIQGLESPWKLQSVLESPWSSTLTLKFKYNSKEKGANTERPRDKITHVVEELQKT